MELVNHCGVSSGWESVTAERKLTTLAKTPFVYSDNRLLPTCCWTGPDRLGFLKPASAHRPIPVWFPAKAQKTHYLLPNCAVDIIQYVLLASRSTPVWSGPLHRRVVGVERWIKESNSRLCCNICSHVRTGEKEGEEGEGWGGGHYLLWWGFQKPICAVGGSLENVHVCVFIGEAAGVLTSPHTDLTFNLQYKQKTSDHQRTRWGMNVGAATKSLNNLWPRLTAAKHIENKAVTESYNIIKWSLCWAN